MKHPLFHLIKDKPLLESLAKEYGTPLNLYDKNSLITESSFCKLIKRSYKFFICCTF